MNFVARVHVLITGEVEHAIIISSYSVLATYKKRLPIFADPTDKRTQETFVTSTDWLTYHALAPIIPSTSLHWSQSKVPSARGGK